MRVSRGIGRHARAFAAGFPGGEKRSRKGVVTGGNAGFISSRRELDGY
jgi:hypothetical protein